MDAPSSGAEIKAGVCKVCVSVCVSVGVTDRACASSRRGSGWEECC